MSETTPTSNSIPTLGRSNRQRLICVHPSFIESMVKHGTPHTRVIDGMPDDAVLVNCAFDIYRGTFCLTFTHPSFEPLMDGSLIPEHRPAFVLMP